MFPVMGPFSGLGSEQFESFAKQVAEHLVVAMLLLQKLHPHYVFRNAMG